MQNARFNWPGFQPELLARPCMAARTSKNGLEQPRMAM